MAFKIDTGAPAFNPVTLLPDWFRDQHPEDAPFERLAFAYGQWMLAEVDRPQMTKTARKHMLFSWRFMGLLAECHPEVFDEILVAYALRVQGIDETAPGGSPGNIAHCAI